MPFDLRLPIVLRKARWKVKIRDKEDREHPHVTIIRRTKAWRVNLRTGEFMDAKPDSSDVPTDLIEIITQVNTWQRLCHEWDRIHPNNPVCGDDTDKE